MITGHFDDRAFMKNIDNVLEYTAGFFQGAISGEQALLKDIAQEVVDSVSSYVDSNAKVNPLRVGHVYEWDEPGDPASRLFDFNYVVGKNIVKFSYNFSQSQSIKAGSSTPFYNKAEIMESGNAVTIKPVKAKVLAFEQDGEEVFTPNPVTVMHPGGDMAQGGFVSTVNEFFRTFSQSYLRNSGLATQLKDLSDYKKNLNIGKTGGRLVGERIGKQWIAKIGGSA